MKKKIELGSSVLFYHPEHPEKVKGIVRRVYANGIVGVFFEGNEYGVHSSSLTQEEPYTNLPDLSIVGTS